MLMTQVLSRWELPPSHLIQGEVPKTPFHCLIFLLPLALWVDASRTENTVEALEYSPVCKGFIFIFKPALDFQEPKVQIAAGLIQPFHKQFSTMRFVETDQVSRP